MKLRLTYLFSFFWLFLIGCQSGIDPDQPIFGSWVWEKTQGGWNGQEVTVPGANTVIMTFLKTGNYEERVNGLLSQTGNFKVQTSTYTDRRSQQQTSKSFYLRDRVFYEKDQKTVRLRVDESVYIPYEISTTRLGYSDVFSEGNTYTYRRK